MKKLGMHLFNFFTEKHYHRIIHVYGSSISSSSIYAAFVTFQEIKKIYICKHKLSDNNGVKWIKLSETCLACFSVFFHSSDVIRF